MSKHTPGQWTVTGQSEAGRYISVTAPHPQKNGRKTICRVPFSADPGPYTDDADARLIAAAPDMYEALSVARDYLERCSIQDQAAPMARIISAAIAKAEGR